jgi:proteic killer suppression protein
LRLGAGVILKARVFTGGPRNLLCIRNRVDWAWLRKARPPYSIDTVNHTIYTCGAIESPRHKGLEELCLTGKTRRIGSDVIRKCARILQLLELAGKPEDLNIAGFRFHGLHGDPKRWSVRVTGNYRITFGWSGGKAQEVDFEDYH